MLFQLKESHGSSGIYSFSICAKSNIIVGCPKSYQDWKNELVILEREWAQARTLESELPHLGFTTISHRSKPAPDTFDSVLIEELQHIATIPIVE